MQKLQGIKAKQIYIQIKVIQLSDWGSWALTLYNDYIVQFFSFKK